MYKFRVLVFSSNWPVSVNFQLNENCVDNKHIDPGLTDEPTKNPRFNRKTSDLKHRGLLQCQKYDIYLIIICQR